jgi:hypothetical protein
MPDMKEFARLLEDYAAAQHDFERAHAEDYKSDLCCKLYDRQECVREMLTNEFEDVVRRRASDLAAAIRAASA